MTKHFREALLAGVAALALTVGATSATADEWNRETILTIDQPVVVPGATLTPGTYTFTLGNENTSRDLVYIFSGEHGQRTFLTSARVIRMQRDNDKRDLSLVVASNAEGTAPMMKGWFYPGAIDGFQFVYPKAQRELIARAETVEIPVTLRG